MAQCKICKQLDGKHLPDCPYYTGDLDDTETPIEPEKTYCSQCGELIPNHKITCPLYDSGGVVITDDKSIFENCNKSALEVEEPSTTSELLRVVGDKMCTNMELYEFAEDSSRPSNKNQCPSKGKWNNKNLGRYILSIDDHIKDNQLFALKNVVKELKPIDLNIYFDIKSSRDANNLIFDLEIVNTNTNIDLLTKYTEKGRIEIYGYYIDKTVNKWRKFTCGYTYQYSNETTDEFRFKETGITISKTKGDLIQPPAPGEYHNIDSWIDRIYLDGTIVYNSNYPMSLHDPTTKNPINLLTFNISGNTDTSRPAVNLIIMEINAGTSSTPKASVKLNENNVKVKNPALYSCTAYIEYNGTINQPSKDGGFITFIGNFQSTYKLSYNPKTSDDSTLTVERLSFDVTTQDGGLYFPNRNDIIVLGGGMYNNVEITKFESQTSVFDSMILYYPKWNNYENKYNMSWIEAPLE